MPKFLRHIVGYHDPAIEQAISDARAMYVFPMYQYYATPLRTDGCAKLNVAFRREAGEYAPSAVLEIATMERWFDLEKFSQMAADARARYVLDELHSAVLAAGKYFGWPMERPNEAHTRIIQDGLRFQFTWGKKASPNRKLRVQVEVDFADTVRLDVCFYDAKGSLIQRKTFSMLGPGLGMVEFVLGKIEWLDGESVKITHQNGRDYWVCRTDGNLEFHYPHAENGDAQGMFELGRMYCEGLYVLRDTNLGRKFVETAAKQGYKHAVNYLRRMTAIGGTSTSV